jgi:hypothetical protein
VISRFDFLVLHPSTLKIEESRSPETFFVSIKAIKIRPNP